MNCLVVHAHPDPNSYSSALRHQAVSTLERIGHEVEIIDLYEQGFDPCLTERELNDYLTVGLDHPDRMVAAHIQSLRRAEMLVFVYPTWWSGLPAIMKGWLDRTLLPEVAFSLTPGGDGRAAVKPGLTNVVRVVGITTYGSRRGEILLLGDAGRRTITRSVRLVCARRCRTTWLALHRLDAVGPEARTRFLDKVDETLQTVGRR